MSHTIQPTQFKANSPTLYGGKRATPFLILGLCYVLTGLASCKSPGSTTATIEPSEKTAGAASETRLNQDTAVLDAFYAQAATLTTCREILEATETSQFSDVHRVNDGNAIIQLTCFLAAYQAAYEFWLYEATDTGAEFTRLSFETFGDATESDSDVGERPVIQVTELVGLPNFEPAQKLLTNMTKYRGIGDCGSYSEYEWRDTKFELIYFGEKAICDGSAMDPADYTVLLVAGEGPPLADRLDSDQVSQRFFDAYIAGDREAALAVADRKAVDKLLWDGGAGNNPTIELVDEAIVYEGGAVHLLIHQDGHVGARIVDVELIAD